MRTILLTVLLLGLLFQSCVPHQKFADTSAKLENCEEENKQFKKELESLQTEANEFESRINVAERKISALESDTAVLGTSLRILRNQFDNLNALNNELIDKTNSLRAGTEEEKQNLMTELDQVRINLQEKEDALNQLEEALNIKEQEILERERALNELRSKIDQKDSLMTALKKTVSDALLGFEGKGLTVEQKNGRVYVSMEAKLLFATGSTVVDKKGKKAIIDLSRAIQDTEGLDVMVEGHTDDDEFSRSEFPRNNWDLSVLRATSVINIMVENSDISPEILVAAGRSQYLPVDPDNKSRNRRIEVILSPKLIELYEMLEQDNN